ncbi:hypothetical protein RVR_P198 (plasmid) [Actinacidiphila reveromycinica]|uniref:Uncharacterized protein n=1 Tax=Actinacidiphila reveromycinica TaxID=659352 RepID=A0A7R6QHZ6_9ACTN|nr:hypothetical protein [Streptomyces sp. SN-593]BBG20715.1 hypothetical protein RVR_P198 [Streptomyces sp. SN-593]
MTTTHHAHQQSTLTALRLGLLRTVYLSYDRQAARIASVADEALELLAVSDPKAAEALSARIRSAGIVGLTTDERALEHAAALGEDVATWPGRRDDIRDQFTYGLGGTEEAGSPRGRARTLWSNLLNHHPQVAVALAQQLRALPDTWLQDLFSTDQPDDIAAPTDPDQAPEAAPYHPDSEECWACAEEGTWCRWHRGNEAAWDYFTELMSALATDPTTQQILADSAAGGPESLHTLPGLAAALRDMWDEEETRYAVDSRLNALARAQNDNN